MQLLRVVFVQYAKWLLMPPYMFSYGTNEERGWYGIAGVCGGPHQVISVMPGLTWSLLCNRSLQDGTACAPSCMLLCYTFERLAFISTPSLKYLMAIVL